MKYVFEIKKYGTPKSPWPPSKVTSFLEDLGEAVRDCELVGFPMDNVQLSFLARRKGLKLDNAAFNCVILGQMMARWFEEVERIDLGKTEWRAVPQVKAESEKLRKMKKASKLDCPLPSPSSQLELPLVDAYRKDDSTQPVC